MINDVLTKLDIKVLSYEPVNWKRVQTTPAYIIQGNESKYFLKLTDTPIKKRHKFVRRLTGNLKIKNQLSVYSFLCKRDFNFFKYPKLIKTDGNSYLLLEFIPTLTKPDQVFPDEMLISSLIEFQFSGLVFNRNFFESFLMNFSRKPFWVLFRRAFGGVRKTCGLCSCFKFIKNILVCYVQQRKLKFQITTHGDLHPNNLLINSEGDIYIYDFEKVTIENYWLLIDIVHYSVCTKNFFIKIELLNSYLEKARFTFEKIEFLNVEAQLRFALLLRVSQIVLSSVSPMDVRERYKGFLENVLFNDSEFHQWLEKSSISLVADFN